jgi:serine/threonine protein kinase
LKVDETSPIEDKLPIEMDEATKAILRSGSVPTDIDVRSRRYFPKEYKAEGFKGVVWYGKDEHGGDVAIKFTIHADYMDKSYLDEAKNARQLPAERFALFVDAGIVDLPWPNGNAKFVVFIERWVDGWTLSNYLGLHKVTPEFFLSYVEGICGALGILTAKGFRHDDLRPENVMIEKPQSGDIPQEAKIKVIDTGSMKSASNPTRKLKDDYRWFSEHLLLIRNALFSKKPLSLYEARFIKEIDPLLDRMFEEDRGAALWPPSRVYREFESAWTRAQHPTTEHLIELNNPFDYIAAEHIVSDELLVRLFADSCPWFAEIAGPNPVLLTGPRGSGKSMVFRRISLKALLHKSPEEIQASQIVGFYVSCSSDLRNRLGWLKSEGSANRFKNEIIHYFNLLVAREVTQTLSIVASREDRQTLFSFGPAEESALHDYLMTELQVSELEQLRLQGMSRMGHALDIIEQKMNECYRAMRLGLSTPHTTASPFLADLTRLLSKVICYFRDRKVALLIDDFSVHRIPGSVQRILNAVLWDRQGTYVSKVSAEKYGAVGVDDLKATSEVARELREFDCGRHYLEATDTATRSFARDLLAIRLRLTKYEGTPEQLIGHSKYAKGGLGQALRSRKEERGRKDDQYHGLETISALCSSDVSNLLEVYRRIFEHGRVGPSTTDCVEAHIQHEAIQAVSRDMLGLIKNYVPLGPQMHYLVYWFGTLSRRILREAPEQKKGTEWVPPQTTRIEVNQPPGQPGDELATAQQDLMDELVRRTIFIEMEAGRGRRQFAPTLRWQLRSIYCPAFGTTIYKNTAIKWSPDEFKRFLLDPKTMSDEEFKRWKRPESIERLPSPERTLFDDLENA